MFQVLVDELGGVRMREVDAETFCNQGLSESELNAWKVRMLSIPCQGYGSRLQTLLAGVDLRDSSAFDLEEVVDRFQELQCALTKVWTALKAPTVSSFVSAFRELPR